MTNYIGIDFGLRKVGISLGNDKMAKPLKVINYKDLEDLVRRIESIANLHKVTTIVIGMPQGDLREHVLDFSQKLSDIKNVKVYLEDETLTTFDAQNYAIQAGIKRKKRKLMEDAYSASIILQNFLDRQN